MARQPSSSPTLTPSQPGLSWHGSHTLQERETLIREAAYYRYLEHGCCDGHDVEDWLDAEAEIDHTTAPIDRSAAAPMLALPQQEIQQSSRHGAVSDDKLKRAIRRQPRKAIPQVESIEPAEAPDRQ